MARPEQSRLLLAIERHESYLSNEELDKNTVSAIETLKVCCEKYSCKSHFSQNANPNEIDG